MSYRTILLAVDIDAENASVIDYAFALAEKAGATLHTLYASPVGIAPGASRDSFYGELRERAKKQIEDAIGVHRASSSLGKLVIDANEPVASILDTAAALSADLVVLSTRGKRGDRWAVGSVAEGVLDEAKVPVLVLRSPTPASAKRASFTDLTD